MTIYSKHVYPLGWRLGWRPYTAAEKAFNVFFAEYFSIKVETLCALMATSTQVNGSLAKHYLVLIRKYSMGKDASLSSILLFDAICSSPERYASVDNLMNLVRLLPRKYARNAFIRCLATIRSRFDTLPGKAREEWYYVLSHWQKMPSPMHTWFKDNFPNLVRSESPNSGSYYYRGLQVKYLSGIFGDPRSPSPSDDHIWRDGSWVFFRKLF